LIDFGYISNELKMAFYIAVGLFVFYFFSNISAAAGQ